MNAIHANQPDLDTQTAVPVDFLEQATGQGIMMHGRKKYAVGLIWLASEDDSQNKLAQSRALNLKADFYCSRATISFQHGFGFLSKGHRIGMTAAATLAADVLVGEWHGVFPADNGWWYLAIVGDMISPEGDVFFLSEEEAYRHFTTENERHNWPRFYTPASWNVPNNHGEVSAGRLLDEGTTTSTLKAATLDAIFSGRQNKFLALSILGALFALVISAFLLGGLSNLLQTPQDDGTAPVASDGTLLQVPPTLPTVLDPSLVMALTRISVPNQRVQLQYCMNSFNELALPIPGWNINQMSCQPGVASIAWQKGIYGSVAGLATYTQKIGGTVSSTYDGIAKFNVSKPIPTTISETKPQDLIAENEAIIFLNNRFSKSGELKLTKFTPALAVRIMREAALSPKELEALETQKDFVPITNIQQSDLPYISFTLTSRSAPPILEPLFEMPGLRIESVMATISGASMLTWVYQGKMTPIPDQRIIERYVRITAATQEKVAQQ